MRGRGSREQKDLHGPTHAEIASAGDTRGKWPYVFGKARPQTRLVWAAKPRDRDGRFRDGISGRLLHLSLPHPPVFTTLAAKPLRSIIHVSH